MSEADARRQLRLVALLHAAEQAGNVTVERSWVHAVAYLSNVLAPVWDAVPLISEMLKTEGAPYDPSLQRSLQSLVGSGIVAVHDARLEETRPGVWTLDASYSLRSKFAGPILEGLKRYPDEARAIDAIREIFLVLAGLPAKTAERILQLDATYDDPRVSLNSLVTLYDSDESNVSASVTEHFGTFVDGNVLLSEFDGVGLYLAHLQHLAEASA